MKRNQISMTIVDDVGNVADEYACNGETFIQGIPQVPYNLHVVNNTNGRVLVVASVDGLSIMDGKLASMQSSGYIIDRYSSQIIHGWRLDNDKVARFVFGGKGESYAAKMGDANNVGVIGLVAYAEYVQPNPSPIWRSKSVQPTSVLRSNRRGAGGSSAGGQPESLSRMSEQSEETGGSLGTGFGDVQEDKVTSVSFQRGATLCQLVLRYEDQATLERMGIMLNSRRQPNPFPADVVEGCQPPPGWKPRS